MEKANMTSMESLFSRDCFSIPCLTRRWVAAFAGLALVSVLVTVSVAFGGGDGPSDPFALQGTQNILAEDHFGIVNGKLTVGVTYRTVAAIDGMWAPPYVSSDFRLKATVVGQDVKTMHYVWHPFQVERRGAADGITVKTLTTLLAGARAGMLTMTLQNTASEARMVPLVFTARGTLDRETRWEFARPASRTGTKPVVSAERLVLQAGDKSIVLRIVGAKIPWNQAEACARGTVRLPAGGGATVHALWAIGEHASAVAACDTAAADPARAINIAQEAYQQRVRMIHERLPRLESSYADLEGFFRRSLVHLLMNCWEVPEFVLQPYYGTGSIKGGCFSNYLWNYGENWEIMPLYDPVAHKRHISQFLRTDMMHHFAFEPINGKAIGPWYPVNQEKIVGLIYYHVLNTGDAAFLKEVVNGKTILDHAIAHACYGDDFPRAVDLIDYGPANNHLELRRGYPYNHKMPDLNGRRYANYLMAGRLAEWAGKPAPELQRRAGELRVLLKQSLWNRQNRWFDFQDHRGRKDTRYTVQVFKLLGSGVLDAEEEAGLLTHFNDREFFSAFGLHSMSKTDVAYDQVDIDNGGGGSCTCFPPQIAERLYKAGHPAVAEEILKRILWWGQRLPYWGDSLVANSIDYRKDTPLQCTIDGATVAQCLIFGLFGVEAQFDGAIRICPHPPTLAPRLALKGLKLRGQVLDIVVDGDAYEVRTGGNPIRAKIGKEVVLRPVSRKDH
jgi:hypothetical protein